MISNEQFLMTSWQNAEDLDLIVFFWKWQLISCRSQSKLRRNHDEPDFFATHWKLIFDWLREKDSFAIYKYLSRASLEMTDFLIKTGDGCMKKIRVSVILFFSMEFQLKNSPSIRDNSYWLIKIFTIVS